MILSPKQGLTELLEPGEEGLVITTGLEEFDIGKINQGIGKAYLWQVGQPRKIYQGKHITHPTQQGDNLFFIEGAISPYSFCPAVNAPYISNHAGNVVIPGRRENFRHLFTHQGKLYVIHDTSDSLFEKSLSCLEKEHLTPVGLPHPIGSDELFFVGGKRIYSLCRKKEPQGIAHTLRLEQNSVFTRMLEFGMLQYYNGLDGLPHIFALGPHLQGFIVAYFDRIVLIKDTVYDEATFIRTQSLAINQDVVPWYNNVRNNFTPAMGDPQEEQKKSEGEALIRKRFAHDRRLKDYNRYQGFLGNSSSLGIQSVLEHLVAPTHVICYQGQVIYASRKELFIAGQPEPVHSFQYPITGLTTVEGALLHNLKGRTNLRLGKKRKASVLGIGRKIRLVA